MGIFNDKNEKKKSICKEGALGPPGLSIRGPAGKDAILPKNIILDSGFIMKGDINMDFHEILRVKYPSTLASAVPKYYMDNNRYHLTVSVVLQSNASFITYVKNNNNRLTGLKIL